MRINCGDQVRMPAMTADSRLRSTLNRARKSLTAGQAATAIADLASLNATQPNHPEVLELLSDAFVANDQRIDALKALDKVIGLGAATATTWHKTGNLLASIREYAQAIGAYQQSVELDGNNAQTRHDYGRVLYKLGDVQLAAEQIEASAKLCTDIAPWTSLATLAPANPAYDHADVQQVRETYANKLGTIEKPNGDTEVQGNVGQRASRDRIRVGYFSSWFDRENYMKPVWALVNQHDRNQFEIHLFTDTSAKDGIGGYEPFEGDTIHETTKLTNRQLAKLIQDSKIDILIDLNAYSTVERLGLFLSSPAPATAAWFNMYATSGFHGFDYIIGDNVTVRPAEESHYTEKVLRLPQSYLSFIVTHGAPPIVEPPCLKNGFVTYGSLISQYKMTAPVIKAWAEILTAVPNSKLLLGNADLDSNCNRDYVADKFQALSVGKDRIEFRGKAKHFEFLQYYDSIDIALDAFPYNGGTTTMEAIWQGVPVVTFDGDRWASRTSASILAGTHVEKFVGKSESDYVRIAIELGTCEKFADQLNELRGNMRDQLSNSPACDTVQLARAMEQLYRDIL